MSFIQDNTNFINIRLHSEMKGLTSKERQEQYNSLRPKISTRLKKSYDNNFKNLNQFYLEAIQILGEFDSQKLLYNLFLDTNSNSIINFLCKKNAFNYVQLETSSTLLTNYFSLLKESMESGIPLSINQEKKFIKDEFLRIVPTSKENDWIQENERDNSLIHSYCNWIFGGNQNPVDLFDSFILFTKIWSCYNIFSHPFNNIKAIVFYNKLITGLNNSNLENNDSSCFLKTYDNLNLFFDEAFIHLEYIPLIDTAENSFYAAGYLARRTEFLKILKRVKQINQLSLNSSYVDLFQRLNYTNEDEELYIQNIIREKIQNLDHLSEENLVQSLSDDNCTDKTKNFIVNHFYQFQLD